MSCYNCEDSVDFPDTLMGCRGPQFEKHWDSAEEGGFWSQRPGVVSDPPPGYCMSLGNGITASPPHGARRSQPRAQSCDGSALLESRNNLEKQQWDRLSKELQHKMVSPSARRKL